jgi:hypothetical protein
MKKTKIKPRIKVAPPSKRRRSAKDYGRKSFSKELKDLLDRISQTPEEFVESMTKALIKHFKENK